MKSHLPLKRTFRFIPILTLFLEFTVHYTVEKQQRHFIKEHRCKSVSVLCVFKCPSTSCPDFRLSFTRCLVIFSQVICLSLHSENTTANTSPSYLYTIWHTKLTSKDWAQTPVVWQPTTIEKSFIPSQTSSLCLVFWSVRHSEVY